MTTTHNHSNHHEPSRGLAANIVLAIVVAVIFAPALIALAGGQY